MSCRRAQDRGSPRGLNTEQTTRGRSSGLLGIARYTKPGFGSLARPRTMPSTTIRLRGIVRPLSKGRQSVYRVFCHSHVSWFCHTMPGHRHLLLGTHGSTKPFKAVLAFCRAFVLRQAAYLALACTRVLKGQLTGTEKEGRPCLDFPLVLSCSKML